LGCATRGPIPLDVSRATLPVAAPQGTEGLDEPEAPVVAERDGRPFILTSRVGAFTAEMPGRPTEHGTRFAPVRGASWYFGPADRSGAPAAQYFVNFLELSHPGDLDLLVRKAAERIAGEAQAVASEPQDVAQGGLSGKTLRLTSKDWEARARYFIANSRLYQLWVLYPAGQAPADATAFLDSFRVTP
jgi:hypothetical protein